MRRWPPIDPGRMLQMRIVAALCALSGLGAIVAHVLGVLAMPYFLSFLGVPALLLLMALAVLARLADARIFLNALAIGLIGGILATVVYDVVRLALYRGGVFDYDGFKAFYLFGSWMTGTAPDELPARIGGWTYHFWNGASFGVFYVLAFGNRPFWVGIVYGVVMEMCMLGLFPFFLQINEPLDFIALSLIGHLFYGATLGWIAQHYARPWPSVRAMAAHADGEPAAHREGATPVGVARAAPGTTAEMTPRRAGER